MKEIDKINPSGYKCHIEKIVDEINEEMKCDLTREELLASCIVEHLKNNMNAINSRFDQKLDELEKGLSTNKSEYSVGVSLVSLTKLLDSTYKNLFKELKQFQKFLSQITD